MSDGAETVPTYSPDTPTDQVRPQPLAVTSPDFSRQIEDEIPFLRRAARHWHREKADAEDLVQDTVVQALANAKLAQLSEEAREAGQRANYVALTAMPLSSMLSNLDVALVALAGGYLSLRGTIHVGTVA